MTGPGSSHPGRNAERANWPRIAAILDRALDEPAESRAAFVATACGEDARLRGEVDSLLARMPAIHGFLEPEPGAECPNLQTARGDAAAYVGTRIGAYRIVRELARGGMGWVFLAMRDDGLFDRHAALKVLQPALRDSDAAARFEAERKLLATLEHEGIARLIDAGVLDSGEPYIITEYVSGQPIDEYCRTRRLPLADRLRLFGAVVEAVHHAHRHRVAHRDLKPSNILVTPEGRVKLIDFGIADLAAEAAPRPTPGAGLARRWLTPPYASPEQLRGAAITTASDVYQLGVVLYELLCGRRPYQACESSFGALEQAILHQVPAPPSCAAPPPGLLPRSCRVEGDLDAIVAKALARDPALRYATVRELGNDIDRFLNGAAVAAVPPSSRYRIRKFVRRHLAASATAAAAALLLLLAAGASTWQAAIAKRERDRARTASANAESALAQSRALTSILLDIFEAADPQRGEVADARTARSLLALGVAHAEALHGQPAVKAELLEALARMHVRYGGSVEAEGLAERALALRHAAASPTEHAGVAHGLNTLAIVRKQQGRFTEAQALHEQALDIQERELGGDHPEVARTLTLLASRRGDDDLTAAAALHARAVRIRRAALGPGHPLVAASLRGLGRVERARGAPAAAERSLTEALAVLTASVGPDHPETAAAMLDLANVIREYDGDTHRAEALYRSALEIQRRAFGDDYAGLTHAIDNLAALLSRRGAHAAAEALLRDALDLRRRAFGERHRAVAEGMGLLASELQRQGRIGEAEDLRRAELRMWEASAGSEHWAVAGSLVHLAQLLVEQGRYDEAYDHYRRALGIRRAARGERNGGVALLLGSIAALHARRHDLDVARRLYDDALDILVEQRSEAHPDVRRLRAELAAIS